MSDDIIKVEKDIVVEEATDKKRNVKKKKSQDCVVISVKNDYTVFRDVLTNNIFSIECERDTYIIGEIYKI